MSSGTSTNNNWKFHGSVPTSPVDRLSRRIERGDMVENSFSGKRSVTTFCAGRVNEDIRAVETYLSWGAIILLGLGSGMACMVRYLDLRWSLNLPDWFVFRFPLLITIPALCLGTRHFCKHGGFARSWGLIFLVLWTAASSLWVDPTERGRSLLIIVGLGVTLPLAALINRLGCQRQLSLWLGMGYAAGILAVILSSPQDLGRFGCFTVNDIRVMDSNELGCFSVVIFVLMYRLVAGGRRRDPGLSRGASVGPSILASMIKRKDAKVAGIYRTFWLPLMIGLLAAMITSLTVSRTAGLALAVILPWIWVKHAVKNPGLAAITPLIVAAAIGMVLWLAVADDWQARFTDSDIRTLNGRTDIWDAANAVNRSLGWRLIHGLGCAGIDKVLGEELGEGQIHPIDGIQRRHSHNLYLEWLSELGIIGAALAIWVGLSAGMAASRRDRREGSISRRSLLIVLAIVSVAGVPTEWAGFPALGALLWAELES
jgi:hypothetical protein